MARGHPFYARPPREQVDLILHAYKAAVELEVTIKLGMLHFQDLPIDVDFMAGSLDRAKEAQDHAREILYRIVPGAWT